MKCAFLASVVFMILFLEGKLCQPALDQDLRDAANNGNWEKFGELIRQTAMQNFLRNNEFLRSESVRNLKPIPGGHVYGESEYAFHSESNVNGKVQKDSRGHKIINEDGRLKEYDFEPKL